MKPTTEMKLTLIKINPSWQEADQLAMYKRSRGVEQGTTLIEKDHLGDWSPEKDCC